MALRRVARFPREFLERFDALGFFGSQALVKRFDLLLDERFERIEALLEIVAQGVGGLREALFQTDEALVVIAHLRAKKDVANLVYVGAFPNVSVAGGFLFVLG